MHLDLEKKKTCNFYAGHGHHRGVSSVLLNAHLRGSLTPTYISLVFLNYFKGIVAVLLQYLRDEIKQSQRHVCKDVNSCRFRRAKEPTRSKKKKKTLEKVLVILS